MQIKSDKTNLQNFIRIEMNEIKGHKVTLRSENLYNNSLTFISMNYLNN